MDEATLARALEPFFTTKGVGKGTGLGMTGAELIGIAAAERPSLRVILASGYAELGSQRADDFGVSRRKARWVQHCLAALQ